MASSLRVASFLALSLSAALSLFGCEEAPVGARCESVNDCDRTGSGTTRGCYSFTDPNQPCSGAGQSCLCCPVVSMRTAGSTPAACIGRTSAPDASVTSDSGADSSAPVDGSAEDSSVTADASDEG